MVINEKHDYDATPSPLTLTPSAARLANARACRRFKSAVLKLPHLDQVGLNRGKDNKNEDWEEGKEDVEDGDWKVSPSRRERSRAFHEQVGGEKHHQLEKKKKEKKEKKRNQNEGYQYQHQYGRYGQQTQQQQQSASRSSSANSFRGYDLTTTRDTDLAAMPPPSAQRGKHEKDYKRVRTQLDRGRHDSNFLQSGKTKSHTSQAPLQPEPLLLPKGQAGGTTRTVAERKKHPRLKGADLYVARLGQCKDAGMKPEAQPQLTTATASSPAAGTTNTAGRDSPSTPSPSSPTTTTSTPKPPSLHDELNTPSTTPAPPLPRPQTPSINRTTARASRPCYRCITYMHSVGIKRVFWTNDAGEWEAGKVRDLVDALDHSMQDAVECGGVVGNGVFVTKHEVLMLRRGMRGGCGG